MVVVVAVGKPEGSRRSEFDFPIVDKERTWKILEATARIARVHDCSPARISVAWLLDKPVVASMIIGPSGSTSCRTLRSAMVCARAERGIRTMIARVMLA
jgi:aryl-alcohol dehydrogenase-like predicted oxidoreductase